MHKFRDPHKDTVPPRATAHDVISAACRVGSIPTGTLLNRTKKPSRRVAILVRLRAACAWIMREDFRDGDRPLLSLSEIAAHLGYSDHTTVFHHLRTTCKRPATRDLIETIRAEMWSLASAAEAM